MTVLVGLENHAELADTPRDLDGLSRGEAREGLLVQEMP